MYEILVFKAPICDSDSHTSCESFAADEIPIQSKPPKTTSYLQSHVNNGFLCIIFFVIYCYFIIFYILLDTVQLYNKE